MIRINKRLHRIFFIILIFFNIIRSGEPITVQQRQMRTNYGNKNSTAIINNMYQNVSRINKLSKMKLDDSGLDEESSFLKFKHEKPVRFFNQHSTKQKKIKYPKQMSQRKFIPYEPPTGFSEENYPLDEYDNSNKFYYGEHEKYIPNYSFHQGRIGYLSPKVEEIALKSMVVPLVGLILIKAVSILQSSPLLLNLGILGKRRKREVDNILDENQESQLSLLESYLNQFPKEDVTIYEKRNFAQHLSCSGLMNQNSRVGNCFMKEVCESFHLYNSSSTQKHKIKIAVIKLLVHDIFNNEFVPKHLLIPLKQLTDTAEYKNCSIYQCN